MNSQPGRFPPLALRRRASACLLSAPALLLALSLPAEATALAPPPVAPQSGHPTGEVHGTLQVWHDVRIDFAGPVTGEQATPNPFLDYRLDVTFRSLASSQAFVVPGYFAADGAAADSGASTGSTWRVHFLPNVAGTWTWKAIFRTGPGIATSIDPAAGTPVSFNGAAGSFMVAAASPTAAGNFAHGLLRWDGRRYLHFAGSGKPFLKSGANSPENLLAFADFDGTPPTHAYASHVSDWQAGNPSWQGGKGKGLIGALNYLASRGVNGVYFLTFNVGGDGNDVWPWTSATERQRFDVSKLDQWERVFGHMDELGQALHLVTQETENDNGPTALDGGGLGTERKLYYRELVARFGHHLALQWNLGEENSNSTAQQQAFIERLRALDPYDHPIVVHTFPTAKSVVYPPLLSAGLLEGASLQVLDAATAHAETLEWLAQSQGAGHAWAVTVDELGPPWNGVLPDAVDPAHDGVRRDALWGNLMAGGAGCEWYFGYAWPDDDLDCEDLRSREAMWDLTRAARDFLVSLPLDAMAGADALASATGPGGALPAWCLAQPGEVYALYLPDGGAPALDLGSSAATYGVGWYDPRAGGVLQAGTLATVAGPGVVALGGPPHDAGEDWAVLVRRLPNSPPLIGSAWASPQPFAGNTDFSVSVLADDPDGVQDVQAVVLHFFTPAYAYLGWAQAPLVSPGLYRLTVPNVPALGPGKWYYVPVVVDGAGASTFAIKSFTTL